MQLTPIATALTVARKTAGLSQVALAKKIEESREMVWRWETGRAEPSFAVVLRWCDATHTDPTALLRHVVGQGPMTSPVTAVVEPAVHAVPPPPLGFTQDDAQQLRRIGLALAAAADLALDTLTRRAPVPRSPRARAARPRHD